MPVSPAVRASMVMSRSCLEPNESGKGYEFINADRGRRHSQGIYSGLSMQGIQGAMQSGVLAGYQCGGL